MEEENEIVEQVIPPNFKCGKCNHKFFMENNEKIMCPECGYRILFKLRTPNPITLKTE